MKNAINELKAMERKYRKQCNDMLYSKEERDFANGIVYALDHAIILIKKSI